MENFSEFVVKCKETGRILLSFGVSLLEEIELSPRRSYFTWGHNSSVKRQTSPNPLTRHVFRRWTLTVCPRRICILYINPFGPAHYSFAALHFIALKLNLNMCFVVSTSHKFAPLIALIAPVGMFQFKVDQIISTKFLNGQ